MFFIVGNPQAQDYTIQITKALAMTGIDILVNSSLLAEIKKTFQDAKKWNVQQLSRSIWNLFLLLIEYIINLVYKVYWSLTIPAIKVS